MISHNVKGGLISLVLYLRQAGTSWEIFREVCLLYNRIPCLPWGDEVDPVSFGVGRHSRLCQNISGVDKGGIFLFESWFSSNKSA